MGEKPEENRSKRAEREISKLPDLRTDDGLDEIRGHLKDYMAETYVYLIRRLGTDEKSQKIRLRAERLLLDPGLRHPDAIRLERRLNFVAVKLGLGTSQERFMDAFMDLLNAQLHSLAPEHRWWEIDFLWIARKRALDAYRKVIRQIAKEPVVVSMEEESAPEQQSGPVDPEEEILRRIAGSPLVDAVLASLPAHQRITFELYLEGIPQSGPMPSIQALLGLPNRQVVHQRIQAALHRIRNNPELRELLRSEDKELPPADDIPAAERDE